MKQRKQLDDPMREPQQTQNESRSGHRHATPSSVAMQSSLHSKTESIEFPLFSQQQGLVIQSSLLVIVLHIYRKVKYEQEEGNFV